MSIEYVDKKYELLGTRLDLYIGNRTINLENSMLSVRNKTVELQVCLSISFRLIGYESII
ncbi:hypothetical protein COE18_01210 [Bacillus cereus]|nr:hypothetical protein COE18_01210 [Bacillus cereus]